MSSVAANLRAFREGIARHDRQNPDHDAWGIGLCHFDLERLGFDDGEVLWPGIAVQRDDGQAGLFRVLCDGDERAAAFIDARATEPVIA